MINKKVIFSIIMIGILSIVFAINYKELNKPLSPIQEEIALEEEWKKRKEEAIRENEQDQDQLDIEKLSKTYDENVAPVLKLPKVNGIRKTANAYEGMSLIVYRDISKQDILNYQDELKALGYENWVVVSELETDDEMETIYRSVKDSDGSEAVELNYWKHDKRDNLGILEVALIENFKEPTDDITNP